MKKYRYDIICADLVCGVREHPQRNGKSRALMLLNQEPIPIADCWIFEVDNDIENIPEYLVGNSYLIKVEIRKENI